MKDRSLAQTLSLVFGIAFLGAAILGFIPGITSNYDELEFHGSDSKAELLGIFQVSILHNIVHGLFGILGIVMARTWQSARTYLLWSGIVYIVLVLYGILFGGENKDANFVPVNDPDTYILHPLLAIGLLASWYVSGRDRGMATDRTVTP